MKHLELAAVFIVVAGFASIELGVSAAVLELVGGVIAHNVFGVGHMVDLDTFSMLGIIWLMYVAGLEIDFDLMEENIKSSLLIGFMSFFVPFGLVAVVCHGLLGFTLPQTILAGIALSTTSVAIVYPALLAEGRMNPTAKKILAAAMVTDLFSMMALSLYFSSLTWITIVLVAALFVLSWLAPNLGKKIFRHYKGNAVELEFRLIMVVMLGLAIAGESAGIEAALIAFLLGMITSELVVGHADLYDKFKFIVFGLFAPIFFFTVGLSIEFSQVMNNKWLLLVFLAVCYVGKFVGTYLPARIYFPKRARQMGFLFNSRLSLGIIAATFGHETGLFNQAIYSPLIGTIILAAIVSALLARKAE